MKSMMLILIPFALFGRSIYVDSNMPVSGDGSSWAQAYKTIGEATAANPQAGDRVLIKPGTYEEDVSITSSGAEIVAMTAGIQLVAPNIVRFPAGTDLSAIDVSSHPDEYYVYIARSRAGNNGVFQIVSKNAGSSQVTVTGTPFLAESGVNGDLTELSAAVGRPVIYRNSSSQPETERVIIDCSNLASVWTILYIGDAIGDGSSDAYPADFNIIDGIDLTGSQNGSGLHLQSSNYNAYMNSRVYEQAGTGILVAGNSTR
ncbi:hypothetical protein GF406_18280, partial [candidate division KSB1 bacterium]|nr:hypothetical protein [candidate division KSB1 bacterium]